MLRLALSVLLLIAVLAGVFGFTGIELVSVDIARILFFIFPGALRRGPAGQPRPGADPRISSDFLCRLRFSIRLLSRKRQRVRRPQAARKSLE